MFNTRKKLRSGQVAMEKYEDPENALEPSGRVFPLRKDWEIQTISAHLHWSRVYARSLRAASGRSTVSASGGHDNILGPCPRDPTPFLISRLRSWKSWTEPSVVRTL
jgi:hypothetical protein